MTALTKLFRTTTFRLSLTYLALFSAAAVVAVFYIYWNTTVLLSRQLNQTIDAELKGLAEQYRAGGLDQLVRIVAERSQTPGNSLYLVADKEGKQLAGNLSRCRPSYGIASARWSLFIAGRRWGVSSGGLPSPMCFACRAATA